MHKVYSFYTGWYLGFNMSPKRWRTCASSIASSSFACAYSLKSRKTKQFHALCIEKTPMMMPARISDQSHLPSGQLPSWSSGFLLVSIISLSGSDAHSACEFGTRKDVERHPPSLCSARKPPPIRTLRTFFIYYCSFPEVENSDSEDP